MSITGIVEAYESKRSAIDMAFKTQGLEKKEESDFCKGTSVYYGINNN